MIKKTEARAAIESAGLEFQEWVGEGAFARVARVLEDGNVRAAKVGPREEIVREYARCRSIQHPNVISAFDLRDGQLALYTMELFEGEDLVAHIRAYAPPQRVAPLRKNLPMAFGYELNDLGENRYIHCGAEGEARVRHFFPIAAQALTAVHAQDLVHLDVAPGNLLVRDDELRLVDFGLATSPEGDLREAGAAGYLAPELGEGRVSFACDWYSLGVMLFECLTGGAPFDGGGPEVLVRKQSMSAPRASELCPDVATDLDELCAGLLRRHPGKRFDGEAFEALRP